MTASLDDAEDAEDAEDATAFVTLHVWGVPPARIPQALARMAVDRRTLRHLRSAPTSGLRFTKLLGTGSGRRFTPSDADLCHWALLAVWDSADAASMAGMAGMAGTASTITSPERPSPPLPPLPWQRWDAIATETLCVSMQPVSSRGQWAGAEPFGRPVPTRVRLQGPTAAVTRARIRTTKSVRFWNAVPPVSADLHRAPGLRLAIGIGEAPVGLQGTFSLWDDGDSLTAFAHRGAAHAEAVRRTATENWYAEELFARFAVTSISGTYAGRRP